MKKFFFFVNKKGKRSKNKIQNMKLINYSYLFWLIFIHFILYILLYIFLTFFHSLVDKTKWNVKEIKINNGNTYIQGWRRTLFFAHLSSNINLFYKYLQSHWNINVTKFTQSYWYESSFYWLYDKKKSLIFSTPPASHKWKWKGIK